MGKYKMPTSKDFLKNKRIFGPKPDPVWVYLEREMIANADKKPYNNKVGDWLRFLKDLRYHYFCEGLRKYRRLQKEVGPHWYYELSSGQRQILDQLKSAIHKDLLEDLPVRVKHSLRQLGLTICLKNEMLMKAMENSEEDAGVFIWNLYTALFKSSPSELLPKYTMDHRLLMSSLVFIDYDECLDALEKLTTRKPRPPPPPPKKPPKYFQPDVKLGEYLQKMYVPCYTPPPLRSKIQKPMPLECKIRLRSDESYTDLCKNTDFLKKRRDRNVKAKQVERVCNYKFWEPPSSLRNTDPKMAAYVLKLKMFKAKARPRYLKYKPPYENLQCHVGSVSYIGGHPRFVINNYTALSTGYVPHNGGVVKFSKEYVTNILGFWKYPRDFEDKCDSNCDCVTKWEARVHKHLNETKCMCGHNYDLGHEGKAKEKYCYPATRRGGHWFDLAKIYQMDPWEDFIKDTVKDALLSEDPTPVNSTPSISAAALKPKELLAALLADLSDTPLLIPHLPKANLLKNLQQWVIERIKGPLSDKMKKKMLLQSQRRWLDLKHIDFRARAYHIPFTKSQLQHLNQSHRETIRTTADCLLRNFVSRNQEKQVTQTRLFWATMKYDTCPSKAFLDTFFTYMPGRYKDTFLVNPYSEENTPKKAGRTCPL